MARLGDKALFFTTSPRSPARMMPAIQLLHKLFEGREWNHATQIEFYDALGESDFSQGTSSAKDKAFAARDIINRAPKALGFVDLRPKIALTEAGHALLTSQRPQEVFLRQLLKFQLPSPYHVENRLVSDSFHVRPYLEMFRLIRELEYITFDELKIFAVQLIDYRKFNDVKSAILTFRDNKELHKGEYKRFADNVWTSAILSIYSDSISEGRTRTRETTDASLKKFIKTKKSNLRDYADACFRYLHYTGLVSISHRNRTISLSPEKMPETDFFLSTVDRTPVFINDETMYKAHLFSTVQPALYFDAKHNIVNAILRLGVHKESEIAHLALDQLKVLHDGTIQQRKLAVIDAQVSEIKSCSLYSDILDTYNEIISKDIFDAPLMLEYNTWRAMTMLDGGTITGNFKVDDEGQPLSTAQGNVPDIECDYGNFALSVEVTLQQGQRQYETEGEPVARHCGQLKQRTGKETYCLFITQKLNPATLAHFFGLNSIEIGYYGGKSKIIPLEIEQFVRILGKAHDSPSRLEPCHVQQFLDSAIEQIPPSVSESDWGRRIDRCIDGWLSA